MGIENQWWAFMLTAVTTGFLAWLFTPLMVYFRVINTIIPTSITLLFLNSFKSFFANHIFLKVLVIMTVITVVIEFINQLGKKNYWVSLFKNLILDIAIVLLSSRIITYMKNPVCTICTLLIAYALILCINISFSLKVELNIKNKNSKK